MKLSDLPVGEGVRRRLEAATSRLSHAYIISGPPGSGKHALADYLAAAYVCSGTGERPCGSCPDCRKAKGRIHPDVIRLTIPEGKRSILVEQVRALRSDAYIRPNEARRKVLLIEDAQAMNESAQNALLKVLEDGPGYLSFLLLSENPQQLLPTIRSRCEILSLAPSEEERSGPDGELRQTAEELTALLTGADELALMEYMAGLENRKWDKDTLLALLDGVEAALRTRLPACPGQTLPVLERLRQVRQAAQFNVGSGHLLGWLAAGSYYFGGTKL